MDDTPFARACPSFAVAPRGPRIYRTASQNDILAMAAAWICGDRPLLLLDGARGVGKTIVASQIAAQSAGRMQVGWLDRARSGPLDLSLIASRGPASGRMAATPAEPQTDLARLLQQSRAARQSCLVVIDNARSLTDADWAFLADLTDTPPALPLPVYVLLIGAPEMVAASDRPHHQALRHRIGGRLTVQPFSAAETADYVGHRFRMGACPCHGGRQPFDAAGLQLLHRASGGAAGLVDRLVQRCLSRNPGPSDAPLDRDLILACAADMGLDARVADDLPVHDPAPPKTLPEPQATAGDIEWVEEVVADTTEHPARLRSGWLRLGMVGAALGGGMLVLGAGLATWDRRAPTDAGPAAAPAQSAAQNPGRADDRPTVTGDAAGTAQPDTAIGQPVPDAQALLVQALAADGADAAQAVELYTRAALWGNARAAYYLGQLHETGVGVPVSANRARAWYDMAPDIPGAAARLAQLPLRDAPTGSIAAAPEPERQIVYDSGQAELHWRAPSGTDPAGYLVEFAAAPDGQIQRHETALSAALIAGPVARWRVSALGADGTAGPASSWVTGDPAR